MPADLRGHVADGSLARRYVTTWPRFVEIPTYHRQRSGPRARDLEFYLLFPLDAEQRTLSLVQSTLIVGGSCFCCCWPGSPVWSPGRSSGPFRQAAEIAERFADGHLDERMPVHGNGRGGRLAES